MTTTPATHATCLTPQFPWIPAWDVWGTCHACRRRPLEHEQADHMTDLANYARVIKGELAVKQCPPAMFPVEADGRIIRPEGTSR